MPLVAMRLEDRYRQVMPSSAGRRRRVLTGLPMGAAIAQLPSNGFQTARTIRAAVNQPGHEFRHQRSARHAVFLEFVVIFAGTGFVGHAG